MRYPTMYHASFPERLIHGALNICDLFATNWKIMAIARFFHILFCIKCTNLMTICYNICIVHTIYWYSRKGRYIFMILMDYKKMLHELVDTLDNISARRIYQLAMGVLGRKF